MVTTFLIHPDFRLNASFLDNKRLGKQRAEAKQILLKIEDVYWLRDQLHLYQQSGEILRDYINRIFQVYKQLSNGAEWSRPILDKGVIVQRPLRKAYMLHPHAMMWYGYSDALKCYINCCIEEFINRGFNNTMEYYPIVTQQVVMPPWLICTEPYTWVCNLFRLSLLAKDQNWYSHIYQQHSLIYNYHPALLTEKNTINSSYLPQGYVHH